ncbi:MAG: hypothetical protein ACLQVN_05725 [Bryobacteraceae bacterium]
MADLESKQDAPDSPERAKSGKDEVALELMKFITLQTGYGRTAQASTGFSGKPGTHSPEEHAEGLLELFRRCRKVVAEES